MTLHTGVRGTFGKEMARIHCAEEAAVSQLFSFENNPTDGLEVDCSSVLARGS